MSCVVKLFDGFDEALLVKQLLDIPRWKAAQLGARSVAIQKAGFYGVGDGENTNTNTKIFLEEDMVLARQHKKSISPEQVLTKIKIPSSRKHVNTTIDIRNETTLMAARRYAMAGKKALVLNFANGIHPGGGFLSGSRAQEETLCFASTLYDTLRDDPFYRYNLNNQTSKSSSDYAIVSTAIVFTDDQYVLISEPWSMDVITCAAPICGKWGGLPPQEAAQYLHQRIKRVYEIAVSLGYEYLVLGAWGCGAFGNEPQKTAMSFRQILEEDFKGYFCEITFAISDWSEERRFLQPFWKVFAQKDIETTQMYRPRYNRCWAREGEGLNFEFVFFWKHTPPESRENGEEIDVRGKEMGPWVLSQWYPSVFTVDGTTYRTAEHYMMIQKARLFGDHEIAERMIQEEHPYAVKQLGRQVRGFDPIVWDKHKAKIVFDGSVHKFTQNSELQNYLLATQNSLLVEASPFDSIWGIGLGEEDPRAQHIHEWNGENLLGFVLMEVRDLLQEKH